MPVFWKVDFSTPLTPNLGLRKYTHFLDETQRRRWYNSGLAGQFMTKRGFPSVDFFLLVQFIQLVIINIQQI